MNWRQISKLIQSSPRWCNIFFLGICTHVKEKYGAVLTPGSFSQDLALRQTGNTKTFKVQQAMIHVDIFRALGWREVSHFLKAWYKLHWINHCVRLCVYIFFSLMSAFMWSSDIQKTCLTLITKTCQLISLSKFVQCYQTLSMLRGFSPKSCVHSFVASICPSPTHFVVHGLFYQCEKYTSLCFLLSSFLQSAVISSPRPCLNIL